MAIEFHCPYCTALIRVGDEAAGRQGSCPKCSTRLAVPSVEREPVPESDPAGEPDLTAPFHVPGLDPQQPPSPVSQSRRRQHRARGGALLPLACGGVLLLVMLGAWVLNDPTLFQGELAGEINASVVDVDLLSPRTIEPELVPESREAYEALVESLDEVTGRVRSKWMIVEFGAAEGRVVVSLEPRKGNRLIRIPLSTSPGLQSFADAQSGRLERRRREALAGEFSRLLARWQSSRDADEPFEAWPDFRDSVGLTALCGALGNHAVAVVGRQEHRCVFEVGGALFFVLPASVNQFELTGRRMPDGSVPFPVNFTISLPP